MSDWFGRLNFFEFTNPLAMPMPNERVIKPTTKLLTSQLAAKSTIHLVCHNDEGSGVIIAKRSTPIIIDRFQISSLALTAGHLIGTSIYKNANKEFKVNVTDKRCTSRQFIGLTVVDYSDLSANPQIDPCNGNSFALPNDLAILAISHTLNSFVKEMHIAEDFDPNEYIHLASYPYYRENILNCFPFLKKRDRSNAQKKINEAFHYFQDRVLSEGKAKIVDVKPNSLLPVDYSASFGSTGGPVFIVQDGKPKLLGINVGGCCLPQQFELAKILKLILREEWEKAIKTLDKIIRRLQRSAKYKPDLIIELDSIRKSLAHKSGGLVSIQLLKCISRTTLYYNESLELDHNVAFPVWNPIFSEVSKIINNFKTMREHSYENVSDFYKDLIK